MAFTINSPVLSFQITEKIPTTAKTPWTAGLPPALRPPVAALTETARRAGYIFDASVDAS